jgi:site-specific recombinase XerD
MDIDTLLKKCRNSALNVRATNTAKAYSQSLRVFAVFLDSQEIDLTDDVSAIPPALFAEFPGWLSGQGYSKKTLNVYMSGAKFLMDYMVIERLLELTYYDTVRYHAAVRNVYRKREEHLPRFPKRDDVDRMLEAAYAMPEKSPRKERNIAIVELLASSGCRNNEIVQLNVKDIDFEERSMVVTGKGSKQRRAFFSKAAAKAIRDYWLARHNSDPSAPAFARHDLGATKIGTRRLTTTAVRNVINYVAVFAGIEKALFSPHYFRHAFAIKLLSETHNLALVQDLMGHASPQATRVYAKIYPEDLRDAHREVFDG